MKTSHFLVSPLIYATLTILLFAGNRLLGQKMNPEAILGEWYTPDQESMVKIYKKGDQYYGKLVWFKEPYDTHGNPWLDENNPEPAFKVRQLMGLEFLFGFRYDPEEQKWVDGRIYNPRNGRVYEAHLSLEDPATLKVRGFVGISLIGGTSIWKRKL